MDHPIVPTPADLAVLDPEMVRLFESLPGRSRFDPRGFSWTPQKDELLKAYWPSKRQPDLARALGVTVKVARKRYMEIASDN